MNILELQDNLKDLPDNALMQEMQAPTGSAPQFLVLSELKRRKRMRDDFQRQQNADMPTVAEEVVTAAGMPREGIMGAARAMAPNTNMAQNTGMDTATPIPATRAPQPQMMSDGGVMRFNQGYKISSGTSISDQLLPARIGMVLRGDNVNDRMYVAEQVLTGVYGPEMQSQFTSNMLAGNYGDELKNIAEQFNSLTNQEDFTPTVMGEGPSLQEINPDPTTFVAPETVSDPRERGALPFNKYSTGGLGSMSLDSSVPEMDLDTPLLNRQIIDSGVGIRGADTNPAQELAEFLASRRSDVPGANLPGDSYVYEIDPDAAFKAGESLSDDVAMAELMAQAKIEREGFGAGVEDQLSLKEQLANKLDFAVDANKSERLSEINTPPPSVIAAQANAAAETEDNPTFMGDVVPFLGRASVAAGKSLYDSFFPTDASAEFIKTREQELINNTDPTQDEINRLRTIIGNPDASAPEKANAANDLKRLQERIAVTQTGGNIAATVEGQGIELEAPYIMGPFGPMIDPNYKTPGKTGQSIVDAAAVKGTDTLKEIEDTGLYPDNVIREAEKVATLSDYEAAINPINKDIMDVQNNLKNPYLPDDARAELEAFLETAQQQKNKLVNQTSVDELFVPPSVENAIDITGGYKGLIDTSPVTIAQQAAEAAEDTAEDTTDASAEFIKTREQVLPKVTTDDDPNKRLPITDGGEGGAGFGSTDSRIAKMLSERQKQSESDKWMALAQAGFQIMASKSPTLLGAVGEGGQAGLKALSASKKGKQAFDADMLKLQTQLDIANIRADATRGESGKASATAYAALERAYSDALTAATENPTAPNLAKLEELESMIRAARSAQFGTVTAGNTNSGVIKTPSAQTG